MILPENGNPKGKQETGKINRGHFWDINSSNGNSLKKYENSLDGGNKYHNTLWTGQRSGKRKFPFVIPPEYISEGRRLGLIRYC